MSLQKNSAQICNEMGTGRMLCLFSFGLIKKQSFAYFSQLNITVTYLIKSIKGTDNILFS